MSETDQRGLVSSMIALYELYLQGCYAMLEILRGQDGEILDRRAFGLVLGTIRKIQDKIVELREWRPMLQPEIAAVFFKRLADLTALHGRSLSEESESSVTPRKVRFRA